ncbi:MAG: response regulator transcription factor [Chitinophagaceae bacterium]|nr:MAG: response regulator transcription factor [Chitinophagaceae bacterium]
MVKVLIVDDEIAASNMLQLLIERQLPTNKDIRCVNDPQKALQLIPQFKPTLLMLDIEMPEMNGFDLLNRLGSWDFDLIFTTAYDRYAIKAIRFSALDYLLKPIDIVDLQNALARHIVRREHGLRQQAPLIGNLLTNLKQKDIANFKLALSTSEGTFFFDPKDIIRLEGESNYTRFFLSNHKPVLVSKTLKEYEELLTAHKFIRVHKSYLVNRGFVQHMDREGVLWLTDGSHILVSRRKKEEVMKELTAK